MDYLTCCNEYDYGCIIDDEVCMPNAGSICEKCVCILITQDRDPELRETILRETRMKRIIKGEVTCSLCLKQKECYRQVTICIGCYGMHREEYNKKRY